MDLSKAPTNFFSTAFQYTKTIHNDQYPAIDPTRKDLSLAGKVVVITGASRGLGARAFAPAYAKAGVRGLALLATNAEGLKNIEHQIKEIDPAIQILTVPTNIADEAAVQAAFSQIKETFGHAHVLINNAGVNAEGEGVPFSRVDSATWWRNFEVNVKGTFLVSRAFINQLPTPETSATIITLTTGAAWHPTPYASGYSISKLAAQQQLPVVAALHPNITAIALNPGLHDTDMLPQNLRRFDRETPELLGGLAVWLSHPHAHFLSGRILSSQWDVDQLVGKQAEIRSSQDLTMALSGSFGPQNHA